MVNILEQGVTAKPVDSHHEDWDSLAVDNIEDKVQPELSMNFTDRIADSQYQNCDSPTN